MTMFFGIVMTSMISFLILFGITAVCIEKDMKARDISYSIINRIKFRKGQIVYYKGKSRQIVKFDMGHICLKSKVKHGHPRLFWRESYYEYVRYHELRKIARGKCEL